MNINDDLSIKKLFQSFSDDDRFKDMDVAFKKMICPILAILIQVYIVCYLFDYLHDQVIL